MPDFEIVRDRDLELWAVVDDQGEIVESFDRCWEAENFVSPPVERGHGCHV